MTNFVQLTNFTTASTIALSLPNTGDSLLVAAGVTVASTDTWFTA